MDVEQRADDASARSRTCPSTGRCSSRQARTWRAVESQISEDASSRRSWSKWRTRRWTASRRPTGGTVQTTGAGKVLGVSAQYFQRFPGEVRQLVGTVCTACCWRSRRRPTCTRRLGGSVQITRVGLPPAEVQGGRRRRPAQRRLAVPGRRHSGGYGAAGPPGQRCHPAPGAVAHALRSAGGHPPDSVRMQFHLRLGGSAAGRSGRGLQGGYGAGEQPGGPHRWQRHRRRQPGLAPARRHRGRALRQGALAVPGVAGSDPRHQPDPGACRVRRPAPRWRAGAAARARRVLGPDRAPGGRRSRRRRPGRRARSAWALALACTAPAGHRACSSSEATQHSAGSSLAAAVGLALALGAVLIPAWAQARYATVAAAGCRSSRRPPRCGSGCGWTC